MKTATIVLHLSKQQSVVKTMVTPAEVAFYAAEHNTNYGDNPVTDLKENEDEVERSTTQEIQRLYAKFPAKKIKALYPSVMSNVPESFEDAIAIGLQTALPDGKLVEVDIAKT
jgi:hypothetical protein